jgi:DNA polymerase/3'-5' exonuclease PolX
MAERNFKMSSGPTIPYPQALDTAQLLVANLSAFCSRIEIAGSIRRNLSAEAAGAPLLKDSVGDIEIVAIPLLEWVEPERDLFGHEVKRGYHVNLLWQYIEMVSQGDDTPYGAYIKTDKNGKPDRKWDGDRYRRIAAPQPGDVGALIPADIFLAYPEGWGAMLAIRTGPGDFSHLLVTKRDRGGPCPNDVDFNHGYVWRGGQRLEVPEERDVFALVGLPWLAPHERNSGAVMAAMRKGRMVAA